MKVCKFHSWYVRVTSYYTEYLHKICFHQIIQNHIRLILTLDILLKLRSYLLILVYTNAQLWLIGLLTYFSYSWWAFPNSSTHFARDVVFIYLINWPIVIFLVSHITGFVQILLNNRIIECWINNRLIPQTNFCI